MVSGWPPRRAHWERVRAARLRLDPHLPSCLAAGVLAAFCRTLFLTCPNLDPWSREHTPRTLSTAPRSTTAAAPSTLAATSGCSAPPRPPPRRPGTKLRPTPGWTRAAVPTTWVRAAQAAASPPSLSRHPQPGTARVRRATRVPTRRATPERHRARQARTRRNLSGRRRGTSSPTRIPCSAPRHSPRRCSVRPRARLTGCCMGCRASTLTPACR